MFLQSILGITQFEGLFEIDVLTKTSCEEHHHHHYSRRLAKQKQILPLHWGG